MSQWRKAWRIVGTLGLLVAVTACEGVPGHYPGGTIASIDKYVYPSTTELPQTVSVIDTRSGAVVWSKDIPVGQQLVVRFYADKNEDPSNPDRMDWQLMPNGQTFGTVNNQAFVPAESWRRIDTSFRARGELPPVADAATPPAMSEPVAAPVAPPPPAEPAPDPEPAAAPESAPPVDIPDTH